MLESPIRPPIPRPADRAAMEAIPADRMDPLSTCDADIDALVTRAATGDASAFAALYDTYAPRVRRFLRHQLGDADLAEELLQRTFVKMIEALPRYQARGRPFGAWVFRIARNAVIDLRRTSHPALSLDEAAERLSERGDPVAAAEHADERQMLQTALETLAPDQREVLVWRFFAELSPAETAELMGRSNGAVRILQHRALASLRAALVGDARRSGEDDR